MLYVDIFVAFFRSGLLGYGGGPSAIPLVHKEVVERYKWHTDEEFTDILALANTLPGPIATKMAGYIGYRLAGFNGLMIATLATVLPTVIAMILLLGAVANLKDMPRVSGAIAAVGPVVGVMLIVMTYDMLKKDWKTQGILITLLLIAANLVVLQWLNIHPGIVIGVLILYALLKRDKEAGEGKARETA